MFTLIELINFAMDAAALMLMFLGLLLTYFIRFSNDPWTRHFLPTMFTILILYISCNFFAQFSERQPDLELLTTFLIFSESVFSSILMPMLSLYLLHCCGESWKKNTLLWTISFLWLVYILILIYAQFTQDIYYITPDNVYHRGPWYSLLLFPPLISMAINMLALIRRRHVLPERQFNAFLIYFIVPIIAMMLQMQFYGLYPLVFATSLGALFLFIFTLFDQREREIRQQEENARQRASIMVLQMRPHFIYNTLISIYYLCIQDAEKAQQVILDFTSYLRKNFTAISRESTIPFTEELEHTRAYLAVEQVRYEGRLFVKIDTPFTKFKLPPLTLQPIVENAVRHGVAPEVEPLHIFVSTRLQDETVEVVVENTGCGFQPATDDTPHTALTNIEERLHLLCDGDLLISDREGGGTIVTIRIPLQES